MPAKNKKLDKNYILILLFPIAFLLTALLQGELLSLFKELFNIVSTKDILLTDYLEISGLQATFLNASLVGLLAAFFIYKFDIEIDGLTVAAVYTVIGFSFIGKNIANVLPIYLGGFIYSKFIKKHVKEVFVSVLFGTTLSPVISEIIFGFNIDFKYSIPLGIFMGIIIGFIITPVSKHMFNFHQGYNLYNVGFTGGIIATIITSIFRSFGLPMETQSVVSTRYNDFIMIFFLGFFVIMIILGLLLDKKAIKKYNEIFKLSGKAPTDFTKEIGWGATYLNMGLMGIIAMVYVILSEGVFSGPIVAGIMTVVGFSAWGKHPKNTVPILIGVYFAASVNIWAPSGVSIIMAALFGTTLAPIAGEFGFFTGILAGFLHLAVVSNILNSHGGLNLYNNGFAGGIVASVIYPVGMVFRNKFINNKNNDKQKKA